MGKCPRVRGSLGGPGGSAMKLWSYILSHAVLLIIMDALGAMEGHWVRRRFCKYFNVLKNLTRKKGNGHFSHLFSGGSSRKKWVRGLCPSQWPPTFQFLRNWKSLTSKKKARYYCLWRQSWNLGATALQIHPRTATAPILYILGKFWKSLNVLEDIISLTVSLFKM